MELTKAPVEAGLCTSKPNGFHVPVMLGFDPNITGTLNPIASMINYVGQSGALSWGTRGGRNDESGGITAACYYPVNFNASKSNAVYGKSQTIQTCSVQIFIIIKF